MVEIVKYQKQHTLALRNICLSTAEPKYRQNEAICWMFLDYYLEYEPEHVFVCVDGEQAVGYIVCSTNPKLFLEKNREIFLPKVARKSKLLKIFFKACLRTSKKLNQQYNGGFHINIDQKYQGQGLGTKLLDTLGAHLQEQGYPYLHLITRNRKTRGYGFYRHYGFVEAKRYASGTLALIYDLKK